MSNNFFLTNNDPLLYQRLTPPNPYTFDSNEVEQDLADAAAKYRAFQEVSTRPPQPQSKDFLGELDMRLKNLNESTVAFLEQNDEYKRLNSQLQVMVQDEIMGMVKWRLNNNPNAIKNIQRQAEIIEETNNTVISEERKNISELNDYVKNYSNITFDEYKKIKNNITNENK